MSAYQEKEMYKSQERENKKFERDGKSLVLDTMTLTS